MLQPDLGALATLIGSALAAPSAARAAAATLPLAASGEVPGKGDVKVGASIGPGAQDGSAPPKTPTLAGAVLPLATISLSSPMQSTALRTATPRDSVPGGVMASQAPSTQSLKVALPSGSTAPSDAPASGAEPLAAAAAQSPTAPQAMPPSAAEQVVTGLRALDLESRPTTDSGNTSAPPTPSGSAGAAAGPSSSPTGLRTLTINLSPDHLGPIAITMRMTATGLDIRIAVASPEALQLLERDRHVITAAVEAAGLSRDHLALTGLSAGRNTPDASGSLLQGAQSRQDASASSASAGGGQPRHGQRSDPSSSPQIQADNETIQLPQPRRAGIDGSLYV